MATLVVVAAASGSPTQFRAPGTGDTYTMPRSLAVTGEALTGSSAVSTLALTQVWNTSGTPTAFQLNVTDTASNANSLLMDLRIGGSSRFNVTKGGFVRIPTTAFSPNFLSIPLGWSGVANMTVGADWISFGSGFVSVPGLGLSTGASSSPDINLNRDAADTLAQRRGTNAQAFRVYNTFTDASNYERGVLRYDLNTLVLGHENAGTGIARRLSFRINATECAHFDGSSAQFGQNTTASTAWFAGAFYPVSNNSVDAGTSSNRWKHIIQAGYHEMVEMAAPAAPAANGGRLYLEDNGAGKTRLMVRFATGAAQQIAIEP